MAKCNFSIGFSGQPEVLIEKVNAAVKKANGAFSGDSSQGIFQLSTPIGSVTGSYNIADSMINITVDEKPVFLSCSKIQNELQKYLAR